MEFVAIDFETANASHVSAISLGLVLVKDFSIISEQYWMIKPPTEDFHHYSMKLHGINPEDVADKESFNELWPEIFPLINKKTIIAHNTAFDIKVLRSLIRYFRLRISYFSYYCSVKISQKVWPEMSSHKLNTLAEAFHIELNHHNALDDARASAMIIIEAMRNKKASSVEELADMIGLEKGIFTKTLL